MDNFANVDKELGEREEELGSIKRTAGVEEERKRNKQKN